jgi:hypothetical protein
MLGIFFVTTRGMLVATDFRCDKMTKKRVGHMSQLLKLKIYIRTPNFKSKKFVTIRCNEFITISNIYALWLIHQLWRRRRDSNPRAV